MRRHRRGHEHNAVEEEDPGELHGPYWMRAHKDWRFVAAVVLMLVGIVTYVMLGGLAWLPGWMPRG